MNISVEQAMMQTDHCIMFYSFQRGWAVTNQEGVAFDDLEWFKSAHACISHKFHPSWQNGLPVAVIPTAVERAFFAAIEDLATKVTTDRVWSAEWMNGRWLRPFKLEIAS